MAAEIIFYAILIYLGYKIVFDFIIPVSHAGKQMKQQFRDVHSHMQEQAKAYQQPPQPTEQPNARKTTKGDYIDFEEIK
jgi:uncharacterized protein YybS (DUF2232 family)